MSNGPRAWTGAAALVGATLFVAVVTILHFVHPGYEPAQQLMSELALGPFGWAMIIAFIGLALAVFGVQSAIAASGSSVWLRIVLAAASVSFLAAGIFPLGTSSEIHIAAIASAFVLSVLAMYLFPSSAGHAAAAAPRSISWSLAAGIAASVALGHSVLPMGIGQRLAALCLIIWLAVVGRWFVHYRSSSLSKPRTGRDVGKSSVARAMALPPFGLSGVGRTASALMVVAGVAGVAIPLLGHERAFAESVLGEPLPDWFLAGPGRAWLVVQAVLVIVGGFGLFSSCFSFAAVGIIAGLVFATPVGLLTMVPVVLALFLSLPYLHTFREFRPRWRGEGDPPPGPWR